MLFSEQKAQEPCLQGYVMFGGIYVRESLSFKVKQALDAESTAQHNFASPFCSTAVLLYIMCRVQHHDGGSRNEYSLTIMSLYQAVP